jgi:hypothetical protein
MRLVYVATTRARDLLILPTCGDAPISGWLEVLNPVLYPKEDKRCQAEHAAGCPEFGVDTVLDRGDQGTPPVGGSVAPGLHCPGENGPPVVWWDPAVLTLDVQEQAPLRQQRILEADPDGTSEKSYACWKAARDEVKPTVAAAYAHYRRNIEAWKAWVANSDAYEHQQGGRDRNKWRLSTEVSWKLTRSGGAMSLVVPGGIIADEGGYALKEWMFPEGEAGTFISFEKSNDVFPGTQGFTIMELRNGRPTRELRHLEGLTKAEQLSAWPYHPASLTLETVQKMSPSALAIPSVRDDTDRAILEKLYQHPLIGDSREQWHAQTVSYDYHRRPAPGSRLAIRGLRRGPQHRGRRNLRAQTGALGTCTQTTDEGRPRSDPTLGSSGHRAQGRS